ncbi:HemK2/MTQ2 family protein methyltransferase [Pseudonocardia xishanensis]|uniref:Methyltransferase n=1 Tax=Pseudonocardia xishanensis TaxID=630995 RepID=A0ABP8S400_9PSEU
MILFCPPGVYRAQSDTAVLADQVGRRAADRAVLDLGTGSGALTLAAWRAGAASVTGVDLSRRSVLATRLNCRLHGAEVRIHRGDLFGPVRGRRFGLIVANPPYVPSETSVLPRHTAGRCWDAGPDGRAVLDRICADAADHLTPDGRVLLVHSAVCGPEETVDRFAAAGLAAEVVERAHIPFGPVMRSRATLLERRGLIEPGDRLEELVVVEARRV